MKSTKDVIDHYLDAFEVGDPDKILAVFSDESVVICGDTIYRGLSEIKRFFELCDDRSIASRRAY